MNTADLTCFQLSISDHIAHLVLSRPEAMNTMGPAFWRELDQVLEQLHHSGAARVLVISSTGKHFSAGMALDVFGGAIQMDDAHPEGRAAIADLLAALQATFTRLETLRIPVVVAIQGGCVGGAVDMVTAACIRYATQDAFFCVQEINIGMTADVGTLQRLPKIIPDGVARELAYTGERMPAQRAYECGLVNQVFDDHESLVDGTLEIAARIASKSPLAIWGTKEMINFARDHTVADSLKYMAGWQAGMFQPGDMLEEFGAKADKRDAEFEPIPPRPGSV